ncbi:MAG: FAD-dependent oxidoreductase [Campylobacterota bacterium]|nr:FAD-dependent oxidoreductase [Campylobacterota bacterium]
MVDVLVIGSGGAGLTAALSAKAEGASVLVVGKYYPTNSQTSMAQGGINAALGNAGNDSVKSHIDDTVKSAHGICDKDMVRQMCENGHVTIEWLESIGVPFSRLDSAESSVKSVAQRQMGGASAKRACYAQDYTGLKILHTIYDTCLKEQIEFLDEHYLLNLITKDGTVKGATFFNMRSGEVLQIDAKSVIMATGGYGSIYHGYTTNAHGSTGDGVAAVLRAGGAVSDMEFIQFHPTALKHSAILISESARGEGGCLVNEQGKRFVDELKPRDEVARAIFSQIQNGQRVYLDLRHLGEEKLKELLPQEVELCKIHEHVDPAAELIPIKPVAHYTMGGIDVDQALEVNGINGCFAVGECSNAKVHGANRLGGNSLLEIIAFGHFAGQNACKHSIYASSKPADNRQRESDTAEIEALLLQETTGNFYPYREALGTLFYEKVGIVRENTQLNEALEEAISMQIAQKEMGISDKSQTNNQNLIEFLEFKNALLLAPTIISAAITRNESRGAHYKIGFEYENEAFKKHIVLQWKNENNEE